VLRLRPNFSSRGSTTAKLIVFLLNHRGIPAKLADTRELIITDSNFGDAQLDAFLKRILSR
jgi:aspartokinase